MVSNHSTFGAVQTLPDFKTLAAIELGISAAAVTQWHRGWTSFALAEWKSNKSEPKKKFKNPKILGNVKEVCFETSGFVKLHLKVNVYQGFY